MTAPQTVLVAGGSGKLGGPIVRGLAGQGFRVAVPTRSVEGAALRLSEVAADSLELIEADLSAPDGIGVILRELERLELSITKLVYSARSLDSLAIGADGETGRSEFLAELELQTVIPYQLTMALANSDRHALDSVVLMGSQYGLVAPNPELYEGTLAGSPVQYGVAKAALHHLTRELAVRLAPAVRVNAVAFGGFEGRVDTAFRDRYSRMVPMNRMLREEEAIGPVQFLLSDDASSIRGHVLVADGGWSIW